MPITAYTCELFLDEKFPIKGLIKAHNNDSI